MNSFYKHMAALLSAAIIFVNAAAAYSRNGVYRDKLALWSDTVLKSPGKQRPHANYASALHGAGFSELAIHEMETALMIEEKSLPLNDEIYAELGKVYFEMGNTEEAIVAWKKGLAINPFSANLLNNLSIGLLEIKRFTDAIWYAEKAVLSNPQSPRPLNTMGEIFLAKGDYEKSSEYFLKAIALDPDTPLRYWNAALSFEGLGRFDESLGYMGTYASMVNDEKEKAEAFMIMEKIRHSAASGLPVRAVPAPQRGGQVRTQTGRN